MVISSVPHESSSNIDCHSHPIDLSTASYLRNLSVRSQTPRLRKSSLHSHVMAIRQMRLQNCLAI